MALLAGYAPDLNPVHCLWAWPSLVVRMLGPVIDRCRPEAACRYPRTAALPTSIAPQAGARPSASGMIEAMAHRPDEHRVRDDEAEATGARIQQGRSVLAISATSKPCGVAMPLIHRVSRSCSFCLSGK